MKDSRFEKSLVIGDSCNMAYVLLRFLDRVEILSVSTLQTERKREEEEELV